VNFASTLPKALILLQLQRHHFRHDGTGARARSFDGWVQVERHGGFLSGWWFQPTPLKNDGVSSSVGMMTFSTEWKNKKCSKLQTTNQSCFFLMFFF